jgi:hypothetical protein
VEKGRIGTDAEGRVVFIWEGAVGYLPDRPVLQTLERLSIRTGQYRKAINYWKVHGKALSLMWTLLQRTNWRIDMCVTSRGPGFTQALADRVMEENWPMRYVFCDNELGRKLPYMPDVQRVFYGHEEQRFAYGPQGYHLDFSKPISVS